MNISKDTMFAGELVCYQNEEGYRFSIDSVLLAHFSLHWKKATILDMGCGCGILGLILLYRNDRAILSIEGLEYQKDLAQLAMRNAVENEYESKLKITHGDLKKIKSIFPVEYFSHIICNPPFYKIGSGRPSENNETFLAKHQVAATINDIATSAAYVLKNRGMFTSIFPAELLSELFQALLKKRLQPKRLRCVYSYPEARSASLVLVECIKNGRAGLDVMRPLNIYCTKNGDYSNEVAAMYLPNTA